MSLLRKIRAITIGSLNARILLAMAAILFTSFLAFHFISKQMEKLYFIPIFDRFDELELRDALNAYQGGGKEALHEYLNGLNATFGGNHYLLDAYGVDLDSRADRSAMLPPASEDKSRTEVRGLYVITHRSGDGRYWFAVQSQSIRPHVWSFLPYYFLVIAATVILCWFAWISIVEPIRKIAATIATFGHGNLSLRIHTRREDEIGQLGNSFDQMAERLERLILNKRRLLADISHELRSPLARLKFAVKLARTSPDSNAALDRIERDINRIASLVADMVEITSIEDDPAAREMSVVLLREIVKEVVRDCSLEADVRGCRIVVEGALTRALNGNKELLRRAIENVLRNAIRYSPRDSVIRMNLAESDAEASIEIRDRGPGVPSEAVARLFDPFFRVEEARVPNGGGSGLGLSIAKRAVQLHQGVITAENAAPGLCVRISLPFRTMRGA